MLSPEAALAGGGHSARALSVLLGALGVCVAALLWRQLAAVLPVGSVPSVAAREGLATAWLVPGAIVLLLMVLTQQAARFLSGKSAPALGRDGPFLVHNQAVITDTVEQMAIFGPCFMALAAGAPPAATAQVLALGGVFAAARLVFWLGALAAPLGRAATLAVTAATALAALWVWLVP